MKKEKKTVMLTDNEEDSIHYVVALFPFLWFQDKTEKEN